MFGSDSKAGRGMGKLYREKRGNFRCALVGGCWHGKAGGGLTKSKASSATGSRSIFSFFSAWFSVANRDKS